MTRQGKLLIISAPSGSGKSTLISALFKSVPDLAFSISATSRPPRGSERDGVEYYFLSAREFRDKIAAGEFLEYVEVYHDRFYGTLKAPVEELLAQGKHVVLDVDVIGGCNIKRMYGRRALSVFVRPPSIDELRRRLVKRATDSPETISERIARAEYELTFADKYDCTVINDDLATAERELIDRVTHFFDTPCAD